MNLFLYASLRCHWQITYGDDLIGTSVGEMKEFTYFRYSKVLDAMKN